MSGGVLISGGLMSGGLGGSGASGLSGALGVLGVLGGVAGVLGASAAVSLGGLLAGVLGVSAGASAAGVLGASAAGASSGWLLPLSSADRLARLTQPLPVSRWMFSWRSTRHWSSRSDAGWAAENSVRPIRAKMILTACQCRLHADDPR